MGSLSLRIESSLYLTVLKEALSSVIDIESDMCLDAHSEVRVDNKIDEEALDNLVHAFMRVKDAKAVLENIQRINVDDPNALPTKIFLSAQAVEILERGLQVHTDMLHDSVVEPFYRIKAENGVVCLSYEAFELLRKKIEENVDKLITAKDLHAIVSRA